MWHDSRPYIIRVGIRIIIFLYFNFINLHMSIIIYYYKFVNSLLRQKPRLKGVSIFLYLYDKENN